jgi:hypothetical protein
MTNGDTPVFSSGALPIAALLLGALFAVGPLVSVASILRGVPSAWCEEHASPAAVEVIREGGDSTSIEGRFSAIPFGVSCRYDASHESAVTMEPTWGATLALGGGALLGVAGLSGVVIGSVRQRGMSREG